MSYETNFDYSGDVTKVQSITFGIMSPEMIRRQSVVQVVHHDTFCGNGPVTGGLFDPRMGVLEYGQICTTDGQTSKDTPGFFGHIELSQPVFHVQYFPIVQKILRCICYRCGSLLHAKMSLDIPHKQRLSHLFDASKKVKICPSCAAIPPDKIVKTELCKVHATWGVPTPNAVTPGETEEKKLVFTPQYVSDLFKLLTDDTCWKLGLDPKLSHPKWMIMTVFPVCPPSCRPSVHQDNGQRMEDDITIKYCDILKYNKLLADKLKNDPEAKIIDDWHILLQYHVSTLIDNEIAGVLPAAQRSGRPLKGLRQRLKGKEGRIRGNLMGKRVNFSSRTVITPDPVIDLDELGVPRRIATQLTYPEKITRKNIQRLKECVRNGCKVYPGARAVFKSKHKKTISLNHIDRYQFAQLLEIGDIVIRHITNGDWVLFNRQPSLHKMSMMGHRIRILDGLTFRLNISATTPYNADFDGDEMNMHVPQSAATANEIASLASVNTQIVSPALNMPIITFVQDAVLGGHLMTMDVSFPFTHREMMNSLGWNANYKGNLPSKESFSGIEGLSYCIPDITLDIKNRCGTYVKIKRGEISPDSGVFDKKVFTSLIHSIFRDKGHAACGNFFNSTQHMIRAYLLKNSFSVGIRDLVLSDDVKIAIEESIQQHILDAEKAIQTIHLKMFENMTSESQQEAFENRLNQKLTAARSSAENILKKLHDEINTNRFMNMVHGGSKGKLINLAQMTACLGQQAIDGKRVPYGFNCRTLPHFTKYDDRASARGFVASSFQKGMNSLEFFFHAMAGREGIIDTAVKTSSTGYIQRKLMKALEDYTVSWAGCVKDAQNNVIQFLYGDDNSDGAALEFQSVPILRIDDIHEAYSMKTLLDPPNLTRMESFCETLKEMKAWYVDVIWGTQPEYMVKFPMHIDRILKKVLSDVPNKPTTVTTSLTPMYVLDAYDDLLKRLSQSAYNSGTWMVQFVVYQHAHPRHLIETLKLPVEYFDRFVEEIKVLYFRSRIEPGDAVGPIAAQSIGEPCTQLTLNTFHLSGVGSKSNITRGVPRLQELFHLSKNAKKSSLTVRLPPSKGCDKNVAHRVSVDICLISLKSLLKDTQIIYAPSKTSDRDINQLDELLQSIDPPAPSNPWQLVFNFNKKKLLEKNVLMEEIYYSFIQVYRSGVFCEFSDDNSQFLTLTVKVDKNNTELRKLIEPNTIPEVSILRIICSRSVEDIIIRGVDSIQSTSLRLDIGSQTNKEWLIDTDGSNFIDVSLHPDVDANRTVSNDVMEMYTVFGIEAARLAIVREIREVMDEASEIDPRHIHLLVDMMTNKGILTPIDRNGMKLTNVGPLAKCSFEEADQQLYKAAICGETDNITGVSANIILGQVPPCGTGIVDVKLNEDMLSVLLANHPDGNNADIANSTVAKNISFDFDM